MTGVLSRVAGHRKHIIRLFNAAPVASRLGRRARLPVYDEAVREALILLWEASDRVCGKRLKPLLPLLVTALERHGHLTLDVTLFVRLQSELPGVFPDGQLRTFQRRVREWRHAAARQLVFASPSEDAP